MFTTQPYADHGNFYMRMSPRNIRLWWYASLALLAIIIGLFVLGIVEAVKVLQKGGLEYVYNNPQKWKYWSTIMSLNLVGSFGLPFLGSFDPSSIFEFFFYKKSGNSKGKVTKNSLTQRQVSYLKKIQKSTCYQYDAKKAHVQNYSAVKMLHPDIFFNILLVNMGFQFTVLILILTEFEDKGKVSSRNEKGILTQKRVPFSEYVNKKILITPSIFKILFIIVIAMYGISILAGILSMLLYFRLTSYVAEKEVPCSELPNLIDLDLLRNYYTNK